MVLTELHKISMAHKNKTNQSPYKSRHKAGPRTRLGKHRKPEVIYELNEANDRLADIFRNHDFKLVTHAQRLQLAHFYQLLMENQKKQNFTRLISLRDIAIRHFIDSLIILNHVSLQFPILDVGTGPGFPGIPLKILFPDEKIILAEGVQKRIEFLKLVREQMNLPKLEIIGRNVNSDFLYPVQGVITRAVEDITNTLGNVINSVELGGRVYFMKGPNVDPEIHAAIERWGEYYSLDRDVSYTLPHTTHARRLVIFEKYKNLALAESEDV
jgi:16S rRNA (guanine527-N7)-methyltransferase